MTNVNKKNMKLNSTFRKKNKNLRTTSLKKIGGTKLNKKIKKEKKHNFKYNGGRDSTQLKAGEVTVKFPYSPTNISKDI